MVNQPVLPPGPSVLPDADVNFAFLMHEIFLDFFERTFLAS